MVAISKYFHLENQSLIQLIISFNLLQVPRGDKGDGSGGSSSSKRSRLERKAAAARSSAGSLSGGQGQGGIGSHPDASGNMPSSRDSRTELHNMKKEHLDRYVQITIQ